MLAVSVAVAHPRLGTDAYHARRDRLGVGVERAGRGDVVGPGDEQRRAHLYLRVVGQPDDVQLNALAGADDADAVSELEVGGAADGLAGGGGHPPGAEPVGPAELALLVSDQSRV